MEVDVPGVWASTSLLRLVLAVLSSSALDNIISLLHISSRILSLFFCCSLRDSIVLYAFSKEVSKVASFLLCIHLLLEFWDRSESAGDTLDLCGVLVFSEIGDWYSWSEGLSDSTSVGFLVGKRRGLLPLGSPYETFRTSSGGTPIGSVCELKFMCAGI